MRSGLRLVWVLLLCLGGLALSQQSGEKLPGGKDQEARQEKPENCSDSWNSCKKPVKYVKEDKGCYVFACEHGSDKERLVRVSDNDSRARLQALAAETGK